MASRLASLSTHMRPMHRAACSAASLCKPRSHSRGWRCAAARVAACRRVRIRGCKLCGLCTLQSARSARCGDGGDHPGSTKFAGAAAAEAQQGLHILQRAQQCAELRAAGVPTADIATSQCARINDLSNSDHQPLGQHGVVPRGRRCAQRGGGSSVSQHLRPTRADAPRARRDGRRLQRRRDPHLLPHVAPRRRSAAES